MRLAPTKFSGQFPQPTKDSEASKHHHGISVRPAPREIRSRSQRPHWYKREITKHFRHQRGPRGLCSATFKWNHRWREGQTAMITLLHFFLFFFFFFSFFFFYRALHWSVQKKIKLSTINLSNDNLRVRAAPAWERTSVNRGSHGLMPSLACACIHAGHWLLQTGKRETNQQNLGSLKFHLVHWLEALQFNTVEVQGPSHVLHPKKGCSTHSNRIPWYALMDWLQNALDCSRERDCQQAVLQSSF